MTASRCSANEQLGRCMNPLTRRTLVT